MDPLSNQKPKMTQVDQMCIIVCDNMNDNYHQKLNVYLLICYHSTLSSTSV